jgi:hypothetical protein
LHATFNRYPVTNDDVVLDENVIAYVAILTNFRLRQHMCKSPDSRAFAYVGGFAQGVGVDEIVFGLTHVSFDPYKV